MNYICFHKKLSSQPFVSLVASRIGTYQENNWTIFKRAGFPLTNKKVGFLNLKECFPLAISALDFSSSPFLLENRLSITTHTCRVCQTSNPVVQIIVLGLTDGGFKSLTTKITLEVWGRRNVATNTCPTIDNIFTFSSKEWAEIIHGQLY